jgi:hypothetical protein
MSNIACARVAKSLAVCGLVVGTLAAGWSHPAKAQGSPLYFPYEDCRVPCENPIVLSVVGGVNTSAVSGNGKVISSLDTLNRDFPLTTQSLGTVNGTVLGGRVYYYPTPYLGLSSSVDRALGIVIETGFLARTGGDSTEPVRFPTFADATGTAHDPPKWTVPILAGLQFPVGRAFGWNVSGYVAAGVNINHREAGFTLREAGAGPTGLPVVASDTWTSVDPAIDLGFSVGVGHWGALPVSVGADVLLDWTRSHTVFAQSPNFRSQSYSLDTGRSMDVMALFSVSLGLAPAAAPAPQRPLIRK